MPRNRRQDPAERKLDEGVGYVTNRQGKVTACLVSYVNCRTKQQEMVKLAPGETFGYGDWDGQNCVIRSFTCQ